MLWKKGCSSGSHHTKPPPKWMISEFFSSSFKSSLLLNNQCSIQVRPLVKTFDFYSVFILLLCCTTSFACTLNYSPGLVVVCRELVSKLRSMTETIKMLSTENVVLREENDTLLAHTNNGKQRMWCSERRMIPCQHTPTMHGKHRMWYSGRRMIPCQHTPTMISRECGTQGGE